MAIMFVSLIVSKSKSVSMIVLILLIGIVYGNPTIIGCIGDSITQGGCNAWNNSAYAYPQQLQQMLGTALYNVSNLGVSGMTMLTDGLCGSVKPEIGSNCSWIGTPAYPNALALRADIYTIMLGTNDAKYYNWFDLQNNSTDSYVLDYLDLILQLKSLKTPSPRVILLTPPPLYAPFPYGMNATVINAFLPVLVKRIARVAAVEVIDVHAKYLKAAKPSWTCDGCHPNAIGYNFIAKTIFQALTMMN
jgi:lysophospholipase L1-like esterase